MRRFWYGLLALSMLGSGLAFAACGSDESQNATNNPCPNGICGSGGMTASSSGSASGSSGTAGGNGCAEAWVCSPWQTDGTSDVGTRTCTDQNNCGTTNTKPSESATLPALDLDFYKCNVEPIFNRGCAHMGCHGTETGRALRLYARGRLRITGEIWIEPGCLKAGSPVNSENCIGSIECACWTLPHSATEWRRNFDASRGFGLDAAGKPIPAGMEDTSELIAQPIVGGKAHAGVHLFTNGSADHQTLRDWLSGKKLGMACNTTN